VNVHKLRAGDMVSGRPDCIVLSQSQRMSPASQRVLTPVR
jgi:hypothetical protein